MNLAVIPARGGSKRIPRKNIKKFVGRPVIAWSIEVAQKSGCFDRIVVSTEDKEIADIAKQYGAEVPFWRPEDLSDDHTGTIPVIRHAVKWFQHIGIEPEFTCCLYPAAPLISKESISTALDQLIETSSDYVFPIVRSEYPIQRALRLSSNGRVQIVNPEYLDSRSQDLEIVYFDAGQFYWGTSTAWLSGAPIYGDRSKAIVLPKHQTQDINSIEDWNQAELKFKLLDPTS